MPGNRRQQQYHPVREPEPPPHQQEQRECARGDYCKTAGVRWENDQRIVCPALTYRAFCERDRDDIVSALDCIAAVYPQLQSELGELGQGTDVRTKLGPKMPVRGDVEAVMRRLVLVLTTWEARVRKVARLSAPDWHGDAETVAGSAQRLRNHIDVLLALEPGWMPRHAVLARARDDAVTDIVAAHRHDHWDEARNVAFGDVRILDELDGAKAGLEILHLHYLCRSALGEVDPKQEDLVGVACYRCRHKSLRRADPPQRDGDPLWYSLCKTCGDTMSEPDYRDHIERLAALERGSRTTLDALREVMERRRAARVRARQQTRVLRRA